MAISCNIITFTKPGVLSSEDENDMALMTLALAAMSCVRSLAEAYKTTDPDLAVTASDVLLRNALDIFPGSRSAEDAFLSLAHRLGYEVTSMRCDAVSEVIH
jgi:hypothetical protein